ncbi:MAG: 7-carboxy-7-deazaguanine synthase QueE [Proteobacteria bacterium]|nr:7-carboxy-7-deazaguanine synthase QueE [Pseudomonadota bacterium]NOG60749.1 7-carboxy-7-deazaguanine synthase QueE [Pseudomonadota bacterium]
MEPHAQPDSSTQKPASTELRINEIFFSLQGESTKVGLPTIFIRLTGCPLRCHYCDTAYAFHDGEKMSIDNIIHDISQYRTRHVTVTGGEPLAQRTCHELLSRLCDEGFQVSLETSGAIDIADVDERVMKIVDIKTPASGEESKNNFENFKYLNKDDQLKFVICDQADYEWAKQKINELNLTDYCEVLFSPAHELQNSTQLANWILEDKLNVRMQLQLHKYLWGNVPGK